MPRPLPGLRLPAYHLYHGSPVKMLPTPDGGLMAWRLDTRTGGWKAANNIVDAILFARGGEVERLQDKDEFIQEVERERSLDLCGEGPVFALYEVIEAMVAASRAENRRLSSQERTMIAGIRRRTYAMFEAELVRRGDPGADREAVAMPPLDGVV